MGIWDVPQDKSKLQHYYGDIVRKLFFSAGIIMLVTIPFFKDFIPQPFYLSIFAIVAIVFLAGYTNPAQRWIALANSIVALIGLVVFEYYAIFSFSGLSSSFFWVNQILATLFFFAFYFSTKTLRGKIVKPQG